MNYFLLLNDVWALSRSAHRRLASKSHRVEQWDYRTRVVQVLQDLLNPKNVSTQTYLCADWTLAGAHICFLPFLFQIPESPKAAEDAVAVFVVACIAPRHMANVHI